MFPSLFVLLHLAHLVADYPLQTDHQAGHKALPGPAGWRANLVHAGTHVATGALALAVAAAVLDLDVGVLPGAAALLWIGATHAIIDRRRLVQWWMTHARQTEWATRGGAAHVDQTAHVLALAVAALTLTALN
ncbi:DUF3307 domain-containing protein [Streptomyces sp. NPDC057682]|uniref:DUF3307 domain-containing protein n=1 Tax=Streptomyces sp. NPDC057682 TaxID=3346210 RepID=UPI00368E770B